MAILVAIALTLVAALLRRRAPAIAWIAIVMGTLVAAVSIVGRLREATLLTDSGSNLPGLAAAMLVLATPAILATGYATRRVAPSPRWWERVLAGASVAALLAVVLVGLWAFALGASGGSSLASGDMAPVRIAGRVALVAVGLGLVAGALRSAEPILRRAWAAWRAQDATVARRPFLGHLADAAIPGRSSDRLGAARAERARLAADLHALVLPDLRRAASAASGESVPEAVRTGVQRALEDVEQLMHERQNIVLDEFGLVAALEWLAEQTEAASPPLRVEVELEGERIEDTAAVPASVAGAAFRISLLALDNVVRHANASAATIRLRVTAGLVELSIADDGEATTPEPHEPVSTRASGRGIADMRREAATSGGTLRITPPPAATVSVSWRTS